MSSHLSTGAGRPEWDADALEQFSAVMGHLIWMLETNGPSVTRVSTPSQVVLAPTYRHSI